MQLQSDNPRAKNYVKVNEQLFADLSARQCAFEFTSNADGKLLFVFMEPNVGQMEIIMGGDLPSEDVKARLTIIRETFYEMVVIPKPEIFNQFYKSLYSDELKAFGDLFGHALGERAKK